MRTPQRRQRQQRGAAAAEAAAEACNAHTCSDRFAVTSKPALPGMAATLLVVATLNSLLQNIGWAAAFDDALAYRAANEIGDA